jgi:membrane-bound lytic murein transglycosylase D
MLCRKQIGKSLTGPFFLLLFPAAAFSLNLGFAKPFPPRGSLSALPVGDTTATKNRDSLAAPPPLATIALNKHAKRFVKDYLKREDEFLQKMKGKSRPWFRTIENIFAQYNLPAQLKYLAIVESGLQSKAVSTAGARGLWQLMPQTALELGLTISGKKDERLHTYRSTAAAARYLRNLYAEFGDWLLVLAAYNSGPGAVYTAMKKAGSKNFWALQRFLPAESRGHVKRFIGVHYFFEGEGSIATQTKAEAKAWEEKYRTEIATD